MPRHKTTPAAAPAVTLNHDALAQAGAAATELALIEDQADARVRAIAARVGYQLPMEGADPDLIQRDIAANMRRSVEACLQVGQGLCVLKEVCGRGNFLTRLDVLGIETRVAQRFMMSAVKFSNAATSPLLKAAGTQSKLFELLVLDDEQIEELELLGQTGELALDDIATMGVRELRQALREAREGVAAKDKFIEKQAAKLTAHEERLARPYKPKRGDPAKTQQDADALQELAEATTAGEVAFARLCTVVGELAGHDSAAMRERGLQAAGYMVAWVRQMVLDNALDVRVDDEALTGRPAWLPGVDRAADAAAND